LQGNKSASNLHPPPADLDQIFKISFDFDKLKAILLQLQDSQQVLDQRMQTMQSVLSQSKESQETQLTKIQEHIEVQVNQQITQINQQF
jgi:hypothetical protein